MNNDYEISSNDHNNKEEATMSCNSIWDLLSVYADGEATPDEATMVENHVAICADCSRDMAFMQNATIALSEMPEIEPPAMLHAAIMSATINRPTAPQRLADAMRRTLTPAPFRYGAMAAAGAVAAITFVAMKNENGGLSNPVEYHPAQSPMVAQSHNNSDRLLEKPLGNYRLDILPIPPAMNNDAQRTHPMFASAGSPTNVGRRHVRVSKASLHKPLTTASGHNSPDYKTKLPAVTPRLDDELRSETPETVASTSNSPTAPAMSYTAEIRSPEAGATTETNRQPGRIQLIAAANPIAAGQIATLADIKRTLHGRNGAWDTREIRESLKDKEIRVDVIRGSF